MDRFDPQIRSMVMASVGHKNTGPEMALRSALHRRGLRYRLHAADLPGRPDIVFSRYKAVIFVHGCYWHAHSCYRGTRPKSRQTFWDAKFRENKQRDARNAESLIASGWRVLTVWECAIKGKLAKPPALLARQVEQWLRRKKNTGEYEFIDGMSS